jgi:spermidine/putrescine transport system ATP-binding protein
MSDRIAVMSDGRVAQCGPPEEIYEHPREEFVAGFIGVSNLLQGKVEPGGKVRIGDDCLPVPGLDGAGDGDTIQIAVRPEKVAVDEIGADAYAIEPDMFTVEGEIESKVYLGVGNQLTLKLAGGSRLVALEQATYRMRAEEQWEVGQKVKVGWHPEHCMILG